MKKEDTRLSILDAGAALVHRKGFNHTGIQEILTAAGVPKGSFYFYFKSKEDFGIQLIDHFAQDIQARSATFFADRDAPHLPRLRRFFEEALAWMESNGYSLGCPIGNLSLEMADLSEPMRVKLEEVFDGIRGRFRGLLEQAKAEGELPAAADTEGIADFVLNSWEGAVLMSKLRKRPEPMLNCIDMLFGNVLCKDG